MREKDHQYLHCLQKLTNLHIDQSKNTTFHHAFIESVLSFSLVSQFCQTLKQRNSMNTIVKWSSSDWSAATFPTIPVQQTDIADS